MARSSFVTPRLRTATARRVLRELRRRRQRAELGAVGENVLKRDHEIARVELGQQHAHDRRRVLLHVPADQAGEQGGEPERADFMKLMRSTCGSMQASADSRR